jgi:hypothetical protein
MLLFQHFIENLQYQNLSLFVVTCMFLTTNLLIPPNLPAGDSLTTTLRILHSRTICDTVFPLQHLWRQPTTILRYKYIACLV